MLAFVPLPAQVDILVLQLLILQHRLPWPNLSKKISPSGSGFHGGASPPDVPARAEHLEVEWSNYGGKTAGPRGMAGGSGVMGKKKQV